MIAGSASQHSRAEFACKSIPRPGTGPAFSGRHSRIKRDSPGNSCPLRWANSGEIVRALAEEYDVDPETLAADVRETLADLQRRKLIELT